VKVVFSERAERNLDVLIDYLEKEWPPMVKEQFLKKMKHSLSLISANPLMFPKSNKRIDIFKCLITKQTALYYRFSQEELEVVTIQDTRRDPKKLKL
jgi:plasmid stabilization system protein ParE